MIAKPPCASDEAPVKRATQVGDIFFQLGPFRKNCIQIFATRVLQLVTSLKEGWIKARVLCDIASFLVVAGEVERPKALSREALTISRRDKDAAFSNKIIEKVAGVFGRVGCREGLGLALEFAATLKATQDRLNAQIVIAQAFLGIGAPERTIEIASHAMEFMIVEGDKGLYAQAMALGTLSQVMADLGEQEQALALAQRAAAAAKAIRYYAGQVGGAADKDGALAATAQALTRTNGVDEAVAIATKIVSELDQVCILREAAKGLMQTGSRIRARKVVRRAKTVALKHEEGTLKAYMLCAAAQALATIGDKTDAQKILRRVHEMGRLFENMANKALVWSIVGQVFAKLGDDRLAVDTVQTAWNIARDTPQAWDRIWSLIAVGNAMTHVGMNREASLAAEQALALLDVADASSNEKISHNLRLYPITRFNTTFAQIADRIPWKSELAVLLAAAQVFKDAGRLKQGAAVAERALAAASAVRTVTEQLTALSLVAGVMITVGQKEKARASLSKALELAYKSGRQYVFEVLWCGGVPTITAIDQGGNFHEMVAAIIEIVDRWPPKAQTLQEGTRQGGFWDAQIGVAGRHKFKE
jgi:tetratricopeptide (TPR) repeat protein